jgi:hypothetical protein
MNKARNVTTASQDTQSALGSDETNTTTFDIDDLPSRETSRWTYTRKEAVVMAVVTGKISVWDICKRYNLLFEEFLAWEHAVAEENRTRYLKHKHSTGKKHTHRKSRMSHFHEMRQAA